MELSRDFKNTVASRMSADPAFGAALLEEAVALFFKGETDSAKLIARDLLNANAGVGRTEGINLDHGSVASIAHEEETILELRANPEEASVYLRSVLKDGDRGEVLRALIRVTS